MSLSLGKFSVAAFAAALSLTSTGAAAEWQLLAGGSGSSKSNYTYLGAVVPFSSPSLDKDGWLGRFWLARSDFDYTTTGLGNVNGKGPVIEVAAGYQKFFSKDSRLSTYVGLVHRDFDLTPNDPNSNVEQRDNGLKAQFELATPLAGNWNFSGIASYTFNLEDYFLRLRPGYRLGGGVTVGPELTALGGDKYDQQHLGLFVSDIKLGQSALLGFNVGNAHSSRDGSDNAYVGAALSVRF